MENNREIAVFFKDGLVIGSCPVEHMDEWGKGRDSMRKIDYDKHIISTDARWHEWARRRVRESEEYAQQALYL